MPLDHLSTQVYYDETQLFGFQVVVLAKAEDCVLHRPDTNNLHVLVEDIDVVELHNWSFLDDL